MSVVMPTDLTFGYVVGLFLLGVADSADADRLPDPKAAVGLISFDSSSPIEKTNSPSAFIGKQKVDCSIDSEGYLVDPMGARGVWLFAGVWKVIYNIVGLGIQSHDIEVLSTHTELNPLDLVQALPAGTPIEPSQYADLNARITALEGGGGAVSDATTTSKGVIQLAGDLGGTAVAPTVPGLADKANTSHTHTASQISDSTATGRALLTAADAAAARAEIGAGTSSLALGTTAGTALDASTAPELIRDTMGTALVAGSNVTITPNDVGDTITIAATGGSPTLDHVALTRSTGQAIETSSVVVLTWDAETEDSVGYHDTTSNTSRLTVPSGKAGIFLIDIDANLSGSNIGAWALQIRKNGTTNLTDTGSPAGATSKGLAITARLAAGDYIEATIYVSSGTSVTLNGTSTNPPSYFRATRLGG